jgi:hypothetical protein
MDLYLTASASCISQFVCTKFLSPDHASSQKIIFPSLLYSLNEKYVNIFFGDHYVALSRAILTESQY